jgi:hypothetical protein
LTFNLSKNKSNEIQNEDLIQAELSENASILNKNIKTTQTSIDVTPMLNHKLQEYNNIDRTDSMSKKGSLISF